ncbi:HypC/HybG/HupF family hydrogenase formation chaperone [Candidatus Woesearchaeota archaeon]|nr:HypC/HybG/HupF family hydrogenase formation chaperone [Candidatus Woesearchaeota archaeon]
MCLAVPGKVIKINDDKAVVDFDGIKKEVSVMLVEPKIDDYVLVHAGFAIEILDKEKAKQGIKVLREMTEVDNEK